MEPLFARAGEARAVLIAGPTASGKSTVALAVAEASEKRGRQALIVNADSMQVYDALRVLTARPTPVEERRATHRLYGHVPAEVRYSAGAWLRDAAPVLAEAAGSGALPIVVGGTGLYFAALDGELAGIPPIPADVRARWSDALVGLGSAALHAELRRRHPASADSIRPSDPQRVLRALEVIDATGRAPGEWHSEPATPLLSSEPVIRAVVEPERPTLYRRIEERFDRMVEIGAVEEVEALLARELDPQLPVMKAIGVREFAAALRGEVSLAAAIGSAKTATRRYAKRQTTWFRHRMSVWERIRV